MKNPTLNFIALAVAFTLMISETYGQISGPSPVCPGTQQTYIIDGLCTNPTWSVSNGKITSKGVDINGNQFAIVVWDNVSGGGIGAFCNEGSAGTATVSITNNPIPFLSGQGTILLFAELAV